MLDPRQNDIKIQELKGVVRVRSPVVVDMHHSDEEQDPDLDPN